MSYEFIEYTENHQEAVIDLQRHLWGPDPATNAAYFSWKYQQNPYLPDPFISLAFHEGHLVGMRGVWGTCWRLEAGQEPVIIPCSGDTVISPDHRRRGLLKGLSRLMLTRLEQTGLPYIISLSACKPVLSGSLKNGWTRVAYYDELSRTKPILRKSWARKALYAYRKKTPKDLRQALEGGLTRFVSGALPAGVEMATTPRSKAMAQLVHDVEPPDTIGHVRNQAYFSWRYRCPLSRYRFLYSGSPTLDGYMVLQNNLASPRGTDIVDWEVSDASRFEKLISAAIHVAGIGDLHIWSASMPAPIKSVLDQYGFEVSPYRLDEGYQRSFIMKETGANDAGKDTQGAPNPFTAGKAWNLRMIVSDDY